MGESALRIADSIATIPNGLQTSVAVVISCDQLKHETVKTVGAAEFKTKCLAMLDDLDAEGIVITKRGKPVAKVVPSGAQGARAPDRDPAGPGHRR